MTAGSGDEIADCSGLCFPGPPGSVTDELMVRDAEATGRDAAALAAAQPPAPGVTPPMAEILAGLDAVRRARLFAGPLARLDTAPAANDELPDPRRPELRARGLFRHLIGHPDAPELTVVLAPGAIADDGLVLPHDDAPGKRWQRNATPCAVAGLGLLIAALRWRSTSSSGCPCTTDVPERWRMLYALNSLMGVIDGFGSRFSAGKCRSPGRWLQCPQSR